MRRRSPVDLEVNHDRWLVSYSDFVTLLFAFFVVMYSISHVNEGKYRVLSSTLIDAFQVRPSAINPIQVGEPSLAVSPSAIDLNDPNQTKDGDADGEDWQAADFTGLSSQISEQFADLIREGVLTVQGSDDWLELELKSSILFPSASADPSLQARAIFEEVAQSLAAFENPVQVEGFTDDVPISNRQFSSNWELSSARASAVVKILANNGVAPNRLSAVGYGEFRPVADNKTEVGRAQNRRVVVMVSRSSSDRPQINGEALQKNQAADAKSAAEIPAPADTSNQDVSNETLVTETVPTETVPAENLAAEKVSPQVVPSKIEPIKLEGGGLLFTTDPRRIREARNAGEQ